MSRRRNERESPVRLLLTPHDRRDLVVAADFDEPMRIAWAILTAALVATDLRPLR